MSDPMQKKLMRPISRLEKQTYRLLSAVVVAPVLLATLLVFAWGKFSLLDTATNHYALFQAYALTVLEVDSGYQQHGAEDLR